MLHLESLFCIVTKVGRNTNILRYIGYIMRLLSYLAIFLATLGNSFDVETLFDVSVLYDLSVFPSYGHTFNEKVAAAQLLAISKV